MRILLAGICLAMFFVAAPAEAEDLVPTCVAEVMSERGWTAAEMDSIQPQPVLYRSAQLQIRSGGNLELACKEWALNQQLEEIGRLRQLNDNLNTVGRQKDERINELEGDLGIANRTIERIGGRLPIEQHPRVLLILLCGTTTFIVLGFVAIINRRRINRWHLALRAIRSARSKKRERLKGSKTIYVNGSLRLRIAILMDDVFGKPKDLKKS